jgi:hypothetical protein
MWIRSEGNEAHVQNLFEDLPPEVLIGAREVNGNLTLDHDEFRRAQWFWERRPGGLPCFQNALWVLLLCSALYIVVICFYKQVEISPLSEIILSTFFATMAVTCVHIYRYAQWKSDYARAMARLLHKAKRR